MYPNFGAVASAMNNKIEIGKESAAGCVLCPKEPGVSAQENVSNTKNQELHQEGERQEGFV